MTPEMTEGKLVETDEQKFEHRSPGVPAVQEDSPNAIIMAAIQKNYDPAFIEKMMDLAERNEKNVARKAYFAAVSDFKENIPTVLKDKINSQTGNSPYSSVGNLLGTVNPELARYDLSVNFKIKDSEDFKFMTISGILSHAMGHSEETSMTFEVETTGAKGGQVMTKTHARMSALTYGMKATFGAVVGIAAVDSIHDDDGNAAGATEDLITEDQAANIETMVTDLISAKLIKDEADFVSRLKRLFKKDKVDDLTGKQADTLIKKLSAIK